MAMQNYKYAARDLSGGLKEGLHRANTQHETLIWLREQGLIPLKVEPIVIGGRAVKAKRKRVKSSDIASFCWQLATMLEGGLPITTAFELIGEDCENKHLQVVFQEIAGDMHKGESLSEAMKKHPSVFGQLFLSMVIAGEAGGTLIKSLNRLGTYYENRDKLAKKVKGAMAYPILVVVFIVVIVVIIMTFLIPKFQSIFDSIGGELPAFTRGFMSFYDVVAANAVYGIIGLAIIVASLIAYCRTEKGYASFSGLMLKIPLIGKVISQAFIAMFCQTLSTLLSSGVSVLDALDILSVLTRNTIIRKAISKTREHIVQGTSISLSMADSGFFPNMVIKMMQVGEESGSMTGVLEKTSEYYERKVDSTVEIIMSLLEPILIISVGAIVGTVIIALYLPIFSMSDIQQ